MFSRSITIWISSPSSISVSGARLMSSSLTAPLGARLGDVAVEQQVGVDLLAHRFDHVDDGVELRRRRRAFSAFSAR